jgi:hypothetical protein
MQMSTYELLTKTLGKPNPALEDFWVVSIVIDDPDHPTWEKRFSVMGAHEHCLQSSARLIESHFLEGLPKNGLRIELYQGQGAREYLIRTAQHELRFQSERKSQPNN